MNREEKRSYTQNRELSWLRFNERVLNEALDDTVPLLERLKFVSIFTSNLDEFFMIRVGSLHDMALVDQEAVDKKSGMTATEQLDAIFSAVQPLIRQKDLIYQLLRRQLRPFGVSALSMEELEPPELAYIRQYFSAEIDPILSPQIVDSRHPFPHLANKVLHVGALLQEKDRQVFGVIPLPASLPEVVFLPGAELRYISAAEILLSETEHIFSGYQVAEKVLFCVTRNADITPNDESFEVDEDFRTQMRKLLRERKRLSPVRLELHQNVSPAFLRYFCQRLRLTEKEVFVTSSPMKMGYVFSLPDRLSPPLRECLTYPPFQPQPSDQITPGESVLKQALRRDLLLSYPFESMDPFLQLIREASSDPSVISIKITIYRLASRAKLVDYLCAAAENGKDVTVMIELRARFDEQNNIDWSQRLEEAGCRILYGFDAYKVHSKVCLITRMERGKVSYITQVGTGNYNEKTACQYTDLSYITADEGIGQDANTFFKNLAIGNLNGTYRHLLVAPNAMKTKLMSLIDREIAKGGDGYIFLKLNSVTDLELIDKLRQASQAGVEIRMIVRGICCLLPGVPGETEHIRITSIVGRFLEHSRIYLFGRGQEETMYISSADFMTRNMNRRVEVACPIHSQEAKRKILQLVDTQLQDNTKARELGSDGICRPLPSTGAPVDAQAVLMQTAVERANARPEPRPSRTLRQRIHRLLGR